MGAQHNLSLDLSGLDTNGVSWSEAGDGTDLYNIAPAGVAVAHHAGSGRGMCDNCGGQELCCIGEHY
jgi:hypothetical protein